MPKCMPNRMPNGIFQPVNRLFSAHRHKRRAVVFLCYPARAVIGL